MKRIALLAVVGLAGCTQAQITADLQTKNGQLFCAFETAAGPQVVALTSAIDGAAVVVAGMAQSVVQQDCAAATAAIPAATGPATPISPPPATAPVTTVAVTPAT